MGDTSRRSAAVTGAGNGLGRDTALGLAARGYRVFGTAMSQEEVADLEHASGGAVELTRCDIADEAAVRAWAHEKSDAEQDALRLKLVGLR